MSNRGTAECSRALGEYWLRANDTGSGPLIAWTPSPGRSLIIPTFTSLTCLARLQPWVRERTHWLLAYHLLFSDNMGQIVMAILQQSGSRSSQDQLVLGPNGFTFVVVRRRQRCLTKGCAFESNRILSFSISESHFCLVEGQATVWQGFIAVLFADQPIGEPPCWAELRQLASMDGILQLSKHPWPRSN